MSAKRELQVGRLLEYYELMKPNERKALVEIARRMFWGQTQYGPLRHGKKNWQQEALEEAMDMSVYLAAALTLKEGE